MVHDHRGVKLTIITISISIIAINKIIKSDINLWIQPLNSWDFQDNSQNGVLKTLNGINDQEIHKNMWITYFVA